MKLIPEQIGNMQEVISMYNAQKEGYNKYFEDKININNLEETKCCTADNVTEDNASYERKVIQKYEKALETAERIRRIDTKEIQLGTKFSLRFAGEEEVDSYVLVENNLGMKPASAITLESPIGPLLLGKKEGDIITLPNTIAQIEKIEKEKSSYVNFIRQKGQSCYARMDKNLIEEYKNEIKNQPILLTKSQLELLKNEVIYLKNSLKTTKRWNDNGILKRLSIINDLLLNHQIVEERKEDTIGIGSHFSFYMFNSEKTITRRVELIDRAVGDELDSYYIERISNLGQNLYGKKEGESFTVRKEGKNFSGIVFDINNHDEKILTNSPLIYQKKFSYDRKKLD